MAKKPYPTFASEAEEAAWLDEHMEDLDDYWDVPTPEQQAAMCNELEGLQRTPPGELAALDAILKAKTQQIALRVPLADLEAAKAIAARKGVGYQTLLKAFIREAIEREQRRAV